MHQSRIALVTGASRGIGRAISIRLAHDGYHVLVNYRSNGKEARETLRLIEESGGTARLCPFDITDREATSGALAELLAEYTVEVLVVSAGIRSDVLLVFMETKQWDDVLNTNLYSFYHVVKPVVKQMALARRGRIIVISSTSGESGLPGQVHYSAAKAGVIGAVKALALECAKRNVLVNAVTPGFIATDMTDDINVREMASRVPLGRFGKPEEVAAAVSFLASDDAGYITGQVLRVNGGIYM